MIRNFILTLAAALISISAAASVVITDSLTRSEIYPGTVHHYRIVVPDSIGHAPYALYVGLDGLLCNADAVIDSLTAAGIMPPTVRVYLQSGLILADDGHVVRYNRSNEFDATDPQFATFLATELLPAVDGRRLPDGRTVELSSDPADRCIFGLSSGGIAAFTAAFHRPDLFGKVFSGCGTFVPMRGGDSWPAIVRKHEPRPLRVFLQDGFSDTWNPVFGSWYEANRLLASALEFAGYDCAFDWAEGGHSVRRATEIFPEVMTWLWNDSTSSRTTGNTFLAERLIDGEGWTPCYDAPQPASATAVYPDSSFVVDYPEADGWLWQYLIDGKGTRSYGQRFYWLHSFSNSPARAVSMGFDSEGWLWVLTDSGIQVCDHNGRVRAILEAPAEAEALAIGAGMLYVYTPHGPLKRAMRIAPAQAGSRPRSQGQG